jgi:ubiquinone biosynthesis protein UbiJ
MENFLPCILAPLQTTMNVSQSQGRLPADIVREKLAQYLGPFTAKNAVQMMSKQAAGTDADRVTRTQVPAVLEALGPTLRTLLGKATAEKVADEIRKELAL